MTHEAPNLAKHSSTWMYEPTPYPFHELEFNACESFKEATRYLSNADQMVVWDALDIAMYLHQYQTRKSIEPVPYSTHVIAVGTILAQMHLGADQIAAGLLHDTVEDCANGDRDTLVAQLRERFGDRVIEPILLETTLQDLVKQLASNEADDIIEREYEKLDMKRNRSLPQKAQINELCTLKLINSMIVSERGDTTRPTHSLSDTEHDIITAILIKLADRLHNMRTLEALTEENRRLNAAETYDVHVKLAKRMGLWSIAEELSDLSYFYLYPEKRDLFAKYQLISDKLNLFFPEGTDVSEAFIPEEVRKRKISFRLVIPNAAAMMENGKPFITLDIGVAPEDPKRHRPTSDNRELFHAITDVFSYIKSKYGGRKFIHFPEIEPVMAQLNKHVLHTVSISVPIRQADQQNIDRLLSQLPDVERLRKEFPDIDQIRINIMSQKTYENEIRSIEQLLRQNALDRKIRQHEFDLALRKWRDVQQHFREYRRMYKRNFASFSSKEVLLALTQRVPSGMMLIIGSPPEHAGIAHRSQLPWLVKRGSTIRDFISDVGSLRGMEISEVWVNDIRASDQTIPLLPFDKVTVIPAKHHT